ARLAHADRRRDRVRPAERGGRRDCRAGPTGALPAGRRFGDVHAVGAVDDGPRTAQRDHGDLQQRRLRHPAAGTAAGWCPDRRRHNGTAGRSHARPRSAANGFCRAGHGHGGAGAARHHRRGIHRGPGRRAGHAGTPTDRCGHPVTDGVSMADDFNLQRFVDAQAPAYDTVVAELRAGAKRTHWIWFVFPQLAGLGRSTTAALVVITFLAEARAYLDHVVLGPRLRECTTLVNAIEGRSVDQIFGWPDNLKVRSSMTLFATATVDNTEFVRLLDKFYGGEQDPVTLARLGRGVHGAPRPRVRGEQHSPLKRAPRGPRGAKPGGPHS